MSPSTTPAGAALARQVQDCGYFPEFVVDSVQLALGGEQLVDHLVHQEATFVGDEIHRHLTVLALTPTRLVSAHTDDSDEQGQAITTSESIPLKSIRSVSLSRVVAHADHYNPARPEVVETWLTLGWGVTLRADLEPAGCADPTCEADHGYTGTLTGDDITIRMSPAADGAESVERLVAFATRLQQAIAGL